MSLSNIVKTSLMSAALAAVLGAPAIAGAQTAATPPTTAPSSTQTPPPAAAKPSEIIVTGSRIKRSTYNSDTPIQTVTSEQAALTGNMDTAHLLQLSSVANNAVQINNYFSQFVETGGPGANTLSLRGIGAQRTLVLIDGERMGPAGVGGTVGPIDLNTLPESIIDHVEIENDGASSIYGSDAVAGVVNIITKKNLDGATLEFEANPSEQAGGSSYAANASIGKTFDKGYISASLDYFEQDALQNKQRPYLNCTRDLAKFADGSVADLLEPNGQPKCWNLEGPDVIDYGAAGDSFNGGPIFYAAGAGVAGAPNGGAPSVPGFSPVDLIIGNPDGSVNVAATRASAAALPYSPPQYGDATALSPATRYTAYVQAGLDLTPHDQMYTTLLFNQRDSQQIQAGQIFGVVDPGNPFNPGFGLPEPVVPYTINSSQRVDYSRIVLGFKGDLPSFSFLNNWTYDIFSQLSVSNASYSQEYVRTDRVNATMGASTGTNGCDVNVVAPYGSGETMAQAEPGVACVPVNYFAAVANGGFTPAERAFLINSASGHTNYKQYYLEGSASGDVIQLPAGPLSAALGFQVRREDLNDTPAPDFVDQNVYNYSTTGVTSGSEEAQEAFAEFSIPVLKAFPLIRRFTLNVSGRVSNYSTYGTNATYKYGFDWALTDWLTLRGTHGTAFRAPALYEEYLADQTSFLAQLSIDPCINYGTTGVSLNIQKNCASQGLPANYNPSGSSAEIFQGGGKGLKPETSIDQTIGVVFQPKWFHLDLKLAVTYFSFDIKNQIQTFGASNILYQCYNAPNFSSSPFCSLFTRDLNPGDSNYQSITSVNDDYVNVAEQVEQGMDVDVNYTTKLPKNFKLSLDSHMSWSFYTNTILLGGSTNNYLGQVGQPGFVGNVNLRLDHGPWTFNYYLDMIGHSSDDQFVSNVDTNYYQTGQTVYLNHVVPFYTTSDVALRRKFDKFSVEFGVKNLFDTPPPYYSFEGFQDRLGEVPLASQYDIIGRSYFLRFSAKY